MAKKSAAAKKPTIFTLLTLVVIVGASLFLRFCRQEPTPPPFPSEGQLHVYALDVGQGDSLLIVTPDKKSILIDAGLARSGDQVVQFLNQLHIDKLDMVVATHPHADHIGGLRDVLTAIPVKVFLDSGQPHTTKTYASMLELVKEKIGKLTIAKAGQKFSLDHNITLHVLGPREPWLKNVSGSDINANSVILRLTYGNFAMLFTGDSEDETETRLLDDQAQVKAQVLKVAHHGSRYASTERFLKQVQPEVAIISCGSDNDYGHPSQPTLDRFKRLGIKIHRTDFEGDIHITTDGNTYQIQSSRQPTADLWVGRKPKSTSESE